MKCQKGQATVELAFSLIFLFLIFFGIIDFGRLIHAHMALDHAGREAARVASVGSVDIEQKARSAIRGLDESSVGVSVSFDDPAKSRGSNVTVRLSYPFELVTPLIPQFFSSDSFTIENSTVMRVE
ncbi:TadE/TadG family type IV pilus assembly protein [Pseudalkalibacillus berkeleyi]|uniref:Pilus assembly protein n=1 Tax=Pseudalkalibacillus berkeleyi TaxID=1069813 RepID=A0ABS9GZM8_9BACL|nr:TadE family protein [Pseudalkalibacillus berkeleyi]MCF6137281.1 pilus assembly protein [Pseudalkalibacillus berkeleyi]